MKKNLKYWIAQSESWYSFKDFELPEKDIASYDFTERPDDFYISLVGRLFDLLNNIESDDQSMDEEMLAVAKALGIYSLDKTKGYFKGIDVNKNLLFAGSLYYLAGYSASAWIIGSLYKSEVSSSYVNDFIATFLRRKNFNKDNYFSTLLFTYIDTGNIKKLQLLKNSLKFGMEVALNNNPKDYTSFKVAYKIIEKFEKDNVWTTLNDEIGQDRELWSKYIKENLIKRYPPIWDFFPSQKLALKNGILVNRTSSLQMPTSAGKTAICELVIYYLINKYPARKILFLAPFRALASELKSGFGVRLAEMGIKNKTMYGGGIATLDETTELDDVSLLITTPEKFRAIQAIKPEISKSFNTVICDEGHLLDSQGRGLGYELLLSKFKSEEVEDRKFIFLSAIISNIDEINNWLGGTTDTLISTNYKPTEIDFAFLHQGRGTTSFQLDFNPKKEFPQRYILRNFITKENFMYTDPISGKARLYPYDTNIAKSVFTALKSVVSGQVALFAPQKGGSSGLISLATEVIKQLETLAAAPRPIEYSTKEDVDILTEYFSYVFGKEYLLTKLVSFGVLYHHGDLPQNIREIVESVLQKKSINLVICTTTLAEGVNLPIKTMVIHSARRFNGKRLAPLLTRDLRNITGRVGRSGKQTKGTVIVTNPADFKIILDVMEGKRTEEVNGFLYHVNQAIMNYLIQSKLPLTNEVLDNQGEEFKKLLDIIDTSLIDLLGEEVKVEDLENAVNRLLKETFAFHQSTKEETESLRLLLQERSKTLVPFVENDQLKIIKGSSTTPRLYNEVEKYVEDKIGLWKTEDPLGKDFIEGIFEILNQTTSFNHILSEFNNQHKTTLDIEQIKKISISWINGAWYKEIAEENNLDIETLLKIFSSIIEYAMQNIISTILRIGEQKLKELDDTPSYTVQNWCYYLLYGFNNKQQLDLTKIGFTDRAGILAIDKYLTEELGIVSEDFMELKSIVIKLEESLLNHLQGVIPRLSFNKIRNSYEYLKIDNLF